MNAEKIRMRVLVPFTVALVALLAAVVFIVYGHQHTEIRIRAARDAQSVQDLFTTVVREKAALMGAILDVLKQDERLQAAFRERDRDALLRLAGPMMDALRSQHKITHFYFADPDQVCVLRVHSPAQYGDVLGRFTMTSVAKTGENASGIELGRYGTLTLRVVTPWRDDEGLIGFLELGQEVEYVAKDSRNILDIEILVLIRKDLLDRRNWEAGLQMFAHRANWDDLPSVVVTAETADVNMEAVAQYLPQSGDELDTPLREITVGAERYCVSLVPLHDVQDRPVGWIAVLHNATDDFLALRAAVMRVVAVCVVVGAVLFPLFYIFLGQVERNLAAARAKLIDESRAREVAQKRHAQDVEQRAKDLAALNVSLEQSNRDMEDFIHAVSHHLQEPLRKIHSFGTFLLEDCAQDLPESGKQYVRRMQAGVERMKELIGALLRLSRIGMREGKLAAVEPRQIIGRALATLTGPIQEAGAEVVVGEDLPSVVADPAQLQQVFQNLIGNAVKFRSPDRPPRVTIAARAEDAHAVFSVADNGIGMEAADLEKVFGVFQRLHPFGEYQGTGVGLALCATLIHRHGGKIWAESEPGKGSVFRFTLPLANT